jgi:hypothetical protein
MYFCLVLVLLSTAAFAQRWQVESAEYGAEGNNRNITQIVRDLLNQGNTFRVDNDTLGGDPAPGRRKTLRIRARGWNGEVRQFFFNEGETVDPSQLPGSGGGPGPNPWPPSQGGTWRIVNAEYGVENNHVNVTNALQDWLSGGASSMTVSNDSLRVSDPAPGTVKTLRIWAQNSNGQRRDFSYRERDNVDLTMFRNGGNQGPGCNDWGRQSYHGVLSGEYQQKFDSYYSRWLDYLHTSNWDEVWSMEKRMRDVMVNYKIPLETPFQDVASTRVYAPR